MCVHEDRKSRETILLKWVGVGWGFKVSVHATLCLLCSHIIARVYFAFTLLWEGEDVPAAGNEKHAEKRQ